MNSLSTQQSFNEGFEDARGGPESLGNSGTPVGPVGDNGPLGRLIGQGMAQSDSSGSTTQHERPDGTRVVGQDVAKLDPKQAANLVPRRQSPPASRRNTSSFHPIIEWEGYVDGIGDEDFVVMLVDIQSKAKLPADMATFPIADLSPYERGLLREGAIVRLVLGMERSPDGQKSKKSVLHFRRLPVFTKADFERARVKARELLDGIKWDDGTRAE